MYGPDEGSSGRVDKSESLRELTAFLRGQQYYTGGIPQELLEPFDNGEVVANPGRQGGQKLVVIDHAGRKHLQWI